MSNAATQNACKLCSPLGASLAFRGIERAMPILHGSQGCSTYIRRYIISHFREPTDIASSNFSESTAVFGGEQNLHTALDNVIRQYNPALIGVATTCLSETIGDDVPAILRQYRTRHPDAPPIVHVSTPSFAGTHADGYRCTIRAIVQSMSTEGYSSSRLNRLNLFPSILSPADLRYLKEMLADAGVCFTLLPDYSETLDGVTWDTYQEIPPGGATLDDLAKLPAARMSIEFASTLRPEHSAASFLQQHHTVYGITTDTPIGVRLTDAFWDQVREHFATAIPADHAAERGRLVDSYVDGHKYVFGARAILFGDEDLLVGLASFLSEVGIIPVLCATGAKSGQLRPALQRVCGARAADIGIREDTDFATIGDLAHSLKPDLLIGNSKGYRLARELKVPLIRVGFPIHDRFGAQRLLHIGYRGAQQLFDRIVCAIQNKRQEESDVGYAYL